MSAPPFDVVAEVEPPRSTGDRRVVAQLASYAGVASRYLVPDNHTGRATVSSLVIASEVQRTGGPAIACLNARDRNLLGVRRDLLTASHLGVEQLLLVHGDDPSVGERAGGLTVRRMLDEAHGHGMRACVATGLAPLAPWKGAADGLFVQVSWSFDALLRWRDSVRFDGPVYAGVMVMPNLAAALRIAARVPQLAPPPEFLDALALDPHFGVPWAAEHVERIRASQAFAGVHLVAAGRHREVAAALAVRPHIAGAAR
jgi:5,10-methylenetetrahydrofolate reductase